MKKYSILGLVLVAASAVTAAVLPKNESKTDNVRFSGGQLQASTGGSGQTCAGIGVQCNVTANSSTTGGSGTSTSGLVASNSLGNTTTD